LLRKDYVRALIQSRKMNRTTIDEAGYEEIKVKFYTMMVEYHTHEDDVWEMSQCYYKIYDTSTTKQDATKAESALQSAIILCLLSKFDNHQSDFMHRLRNMKDVVTMGVFHSTLTLFTTKEVIAYPFDSLSVLEAHACLTIGGSDFANKCRKLLHTRVVQHNLRVVAGYYERIHSQRLASMLCLTLAELESHLTELAASGDLHVKIDRPMGITTFKKTRAAEAVLSDWASDIGSLLGLMESTCHLINRENMVKAAAPTA